MNAAQVQRVAIVTGAGRDIGRERAQALAQQSLAVIALLYGPRSDDLTGQNFHVNGGTYLP